MALASSFPFTRVVAMMKGPIETEKFRWTVEIPVLYVVVVLIVSAVAAILWFIESRKP